jgi:pantoate--beta-alanine ligase
MEVIRAPSQMQSWALDQRAHGHTLAVVPTMGYLHEGHRSLMRIARRRADRVIVTIFVNPTQFGPNEDFERYPRDWERDRAICEAEGVDLVFAPDVGDMYAPDHSVWVEETRLSRGLCGAYRPGHFRGVATVVLKLFHLTQPHVAVFGEKDAQQLRIIRRMVRDLNLPIEIVPGPTVREPDGLAMSSRNAYLSPDERRQAAGLWKALQAVQAQFAQGERRAAVLIETVRIELARTAPSAVPQYIELVDDETLEPIEHIRDRPALLALAVFLGSTRLIDHIVLSP